MLQERVVLITGASRGIGRAMALELAQRGARIVSVARDSAMLRDTAKAVQAVHGEILTIPTDIRDEAQVRRMAHKALDQFGRVDVLVNNAGLMVGDVAFVDTAPKLWRDVLATNLWGAFLCCHFLVPAMRCQGGGTIVNITSGAAVRAGFLNVPYGVSKAGLDRLTLGLGAELKAHNIACISLSPSMTATATVRQMYPDRDVEAWAAAPELTARALGALLDNNPMHYTGQVLSVREYLTQNGLLSP